MSYPFEVLRGWPGDAGLEFNESIASGQTLAAGDVVVLNASGQVTKTTAAAANVGFVVRGNGDSDSVAKAGKAVVLWGNFIARTQKVAADTYAPGDALKSATGGVLAKATLGTDAAHLIVGYVKAVQVAAGGEPLSLTIVVR